MIDAYMHLDTDAAAPLVDLRQRLDESGQSGALLVETWDGRNRELLAQAGADDLPGIGLAWCYRGQDATQLQPLLANPRVLALRVDTRALARDDFPAATVAASGKWLLPHAEAGIGSLAAPLLRRLAAYPHLRAYVPHLGWPRRNGADQAGWADAMARLADFPTVVAGVSAIGHFSTQPFPHEDVRPFVDRLCSLFGAARIVVGSDYPNSGAAMYAPLHALAMRWVAEALTAWDPNRPTLQI